MTDLSPLGSNDSFPADAPAVAAYGREVKATAELIADSVRLLRRCGDENNWDCQAADAFREKAAELAGDIDRSRERYETVGSTLVSVASTLDDAEDDGGRYAREARQLEAVAARSVQHPGTGPDGADVPLTPGQSASNTARQDAIDEIARYQRLFDGRVDDARDAADRAARTIKGALDDDVKDSWWDRNAGWLKIVTTVLSVIIAIAAIVLLTVATGGTIWIVALVVSVAAGLLSLGINVGLASTGNGSWWDVAFDAVGLLTLGAGGLAVKALGKSLPALRLGLTELKGFQAFAGAFRGWRLTAGNLLVRAPFQFLRNGGGRLISGVADDAFGAMATARAALDLVPDVSRLRVFLEGGRQTATDIASARTILAELRSLGRLPTVLAPQAAGLLDDAAKVANQIRVVRASQLAGAANGVAQLVYNAATGPVVDPGGAARVVIDLIGRLR